MPTRHPYPSVTGHTSSGKTKSPVDGTELFYEVSQGLSGNPTILFLDGLGCDGYIWPYAKTALSDYSWVHPHYRGHGQSANPTDNRNISIGILVQDIVHVTSQVTDEPLIVVGHSVGVQVALELWKQSPHRVCGLALLCGAAGAPLETFQGGHFPFAKMVPWLEKTVAVLPKLTRWMATQLVPTPLSVALAKKLEVNPKLISDRDLVPYFDGLSRIPPALFWRLVASANKHSAFSWLPHIPLPTLLVAGQRDKFVPYSVVSAMHMKMPNAQFRIVDGGSHSAPIERPKVVNRWLIEFANSFIPKALDAKEHATIDAIAGPHTDV